MIFISMEISRYHAFLTLSWLGCLYLKKILKFKCKNRISYKLGLCPLYGSHNFKHKLLFRLWRQNTFPISSYERLNFYSRNCERNIPQGFQETIDSYMHCPIKDFSETQEETYPSFIVYEDNSACLQFAKMPKMSPCTKHIGLPDYWFRGKYLL